jgi:hypothetical protein
MSYIVIRNTSGCLALTKHIAEGNVAISAKYSVHLLFCIILIGYIKIFLKFQKKETFPWPWLTSFQQSRVTAFGTTVPVLSAP